MAAFHPVADIRLGRIPYRKLPSIRLILIEFAGIRARVDFLGGLHPVQRCWKSGIHAHLDDNFLDLALRKTDIESGLDVDLQLGLCRAHRRKGCDRRDLSFAEAKTGPCVDIGERVFDGVAGKIRRYVL
jgi:hypothetical protein